MGLYKNVKMLFEACVCFVLLSVFFVFPNSRLAIAETRSDLFAIYAAQTPAVAADQNKNIYLAWQSFGVDASSDIFLQKFSPLGQRLWLNPVIVASPRASVSNLSMDTDGSNTVSVAWVGSEDGARTASVFLQKVSALGDVLWQDPLIVTSANSREGVISSISEVQTDKNGNAFFLMNKKNSFSGSAELFYQVVNSEGYALWPEGKRLAVDRSHPLLENADVDLELNKTSSIAYISWVGAKPDRTDISIYLQKINYDGIFQWRTAFQQRIPDDEDFVQFPGIEMDEKENIFLTYASTKGMVRYNTILNWIRVNRLGQTLWEGQYRVPISPEQLINPIAIETAEDGKIFFLVNSEDSIQLFAFQPQLNPTKPEDFQQMHWEALAKPMSREIYHKQGHSGNAGLVRIGKSRLGLAWNLYEADFFRQKDDTLAIDRVYNPAIYLQILDAKYLNVQGAPLIKMDVRNVTFKSPVERMSPVRKPARTRSFYPYVPSLR